MKNQVKNVEKFVANICPTISPHVSANPPPVCIIPYSKQKIYQALVLY